MVTQNKIFVQIDKEKIELIGAELDAFLADRQAIENQRAQAQAVAEAKAAAKASAQAKLASLGLTAEEINALGL
jgi:hypothetical protein